LAALNFGTQNQCDCSDTPFKLLCWFVNFLMWYKTFTMIASLPVGGLLGEPLRAFWGSLFLLEDF
jgi:hypothetical protein